MLVFVSEIFYTVIGGPRICEKNLGKLLILLLHGLALELEAHAKVPTACRRHPPS